MAPRRETNARDTALEGADLWADVEEDVEKKRHVKDPFREAYVALVAAPFDAFLAKTARREGRKDVDDDVDMEKEDAQEDTEDHVALQHEISARSQQVHLRLEILRRQMQCLVDESSAVLDTSTSAPKRDGNKRKKAQMNVKTTRDDAVGDYSMINLERTLERATLYESGELTDLDLQKTWNRCQCSCTDHEVVGAESKLESMRATLNEEYEAIREQHLLYFGPRLPSDSTDASTESPSEVDAMAQFLEDCKRSIKPFFLEDFVHLDHEESQPDQDSQMDEIDQPESPQEKHQVGLAMNVPPREEDVIMSDAPASRENDSHTVLSKARNSQLPSSHCDEAGANGQTEISTIQSRFCIASLKRNRAALHKKAKKIIGKRHESRALPVCISRQGVDSWKSAKPSTVGFHCPPLVCDPKKWRDLSMSIIDPTMNLIVMRNALCAELDEESDDECAMPNETPERPPEEFRESPSSAACNPVPGSTSPGDDVPAQVTSVQAKRRLEGAGILQNKKPRVYEAAKLSRPLTLRMMMSSIRTLFWRVAQSSCVSYLSTLLRSELTSRSPQRTFVALVFSASLANSNQDTHDPFSDKVLA